MTTNWIVILWSRDIIYQSSFKNHIAFVSWYILYFSVVKSICKSFNLIFHEKVEQILVIQPATNIPSTVYILKTQKTSNTIVYSTKLKCNYFPFTVYILCYCLIKYRLILKCFLVFKMLRKNRRTLIQHLLFKNRICITMLDVVYKRLANCNILRKDLSSFNRDNLNLWKVLKYWTFNKKCDAVILCITKSY